MEQLETRDQMSVSAVVDIGAGILTFTGDVGGVSNDYIEIEDSGLAGGGQVRYRTAVGGAWTTVGNEVWRIALDTRGGNDTVVHRIGRSPNFAVNGVANGLYRELQGGVHVPGGLGGGDDRITSTVYGNIGNGTASTGYGFFMNGDTGNDRMTLNMNGDVTNRGTLGVSLTGGTGVDFMNTFMTNDVDVGSSGLIWVNMFGNDGNDNQQIHYRGELDGKLLFHSEGGANDDWVVANLTMDLGSQGSVGDPNAPNTPQGNWNRAAVLLGDAGNDSVDFLVTMNAASTFGSVEAAAYGGVGTDTFTFNQFWVDLPDRDVATERAVRSGGPGTG
jgi:hypothetical protein